MRVEVQRLLVGRREMAKSDQTAVAERTSFAHFALHSGQYRCSLAVAIEKLEVGSLVVLPVQCHRRTQRTSVLTD